MLAHGRVRGYRTSALLVCSATTLSVAADRIRLSLGRQVTRCVGLHYLLILSRIYSLTASVRIGSSSGLVALPASIGSQPRCCRFSSSGFWMVASPACDADLDPYTPRCDAQCLGQQAWPRNPPALRVSGRLAPLPAATPPAGQAGKRDGVIAFVLIAVWTGIGRDRFAGLGARSVRRCWQSRHPCPVRGCSGRHHPSRLDQLVLLIQQAASFAHLAAVRPGQASMRRIREAGVWDATGRIFWPLHSDLGCGS